ncbi:MAG: hypothetical protein NUV77_00560 [Thermoguttaceae bacterium]|nr:hypothetical protein [Thermoguttaceae bacterium]
MMKRGHLVGGQGVGVDPQVVQQALEAFAPAGRADAPVGLTAGGDLARTLDEPDLLSVEIDPHGLAVERGGRVVPSAVEQLLGIDRRVALLIAAHVQAQREHRAMLLEREEHALIAVLLAEDLVVAFERGGHHPGRNRDLGHRAEGRLARGVQAVLPGKLHGRAEHPWHAIEACAAGVAPVAAGVAAGRAEGVVEGPMGQKRFVELQGLRRNRRTRRAFSGKGDGPGDHQQQEPEQPPQRHEQHRESPSRGTHGKPSSIIDHRGVGGYSGAVLRASWAHRRPQGRWAICTAFADNSSKDQFLRLVPRYIPKKPVNRISRSIASDSINKEDTS